jgi:hypothetical protein
MQPIGYDTMYLNFMGIGILFDCGYLSMRSNLMIFPRNITLQVCYEIISNEI